MQPLKTHRLLWHADKVFFGVVLAACALALVSFWTSSTRPRDGAWVSPQGDFRTASNDLADRGPARLPSVAVDPSTDPDEYLPRPGEYECIDPDCTYIMPATVRFCPVCGCDGWDRDHDGMTDEWERRHKATNPDVADGDADYDKDKFTNYEEYLGGSDPDDMNSIPAPIRLVEVGQELVDALFRGFAKRPDGTVAIQLNWGNDTGTTILRVGDEFRGYKVARLDERTVMKRILDKDFPITEYTLVLKRLDGGELRLPRHQPVREPEWYGVFTSSGAANGGGARVRAYAGETIQIDEHSYVVDEVSSHSARLTGDRKEHYNLELRPEKRPR